MHRQCLLSDDPRTYRRQYVLHYILSLAVFVSMRTCLLAKACGIGLSK